MQNNQKYIQSQVFGCELVKKQNPSPKNFLVSYKGKQRLSNVQNDQKSGPERARSH